MKGGSGDECHGPPLDELGKRLRRSQGWSGFVSRDTRALGPGEDERRICLSSKAGRRVMEERQKGRKEGPAPIF